MNESYRDGLLGNLTAHLRSPATYRAVFNQCSVCSLPIGPESKNEQCTTCRRHSKDQHPLANRVYPLTYAPYGGPAYKLFHDYKESSNRNMSTYQSSLTTFLGEIMARHGGCLMENNPVTAVAIVGSTSPTPGSVHPLHLIARDVFPDLPKVETFFTHGRDKREIDPYYAQFPTLNKADLGHVLLIEDTWVTGSTCQSVAAGLKMRGAKKVSIMPLARALNPKSSTAVEKAARKITGGSFDWHQCPFCRQIH